MLGVILLPSASQAGGGSKRVACFGGSFPGPDEDPAFRKKPGKCVYIDERGLTVPVPPTSTTQSTQGVRWRKWGGRKAVGRGKGFVAERTQPVAVRITLTRPVRRCGRRVYSRAKFRFDYLGTSSDAFRLVTC